MAVQAFWIGHSIPTLATLGLATVAANITSH
jgi:hypothetical protein